MPRHQEDDRHRGLDEALGAIDVLISQGHQLQVGDVVGHGSADFRACKPICHGYRASRTGTFEAALADTDGLGIVMYETTHGSIP